MEKHEEWDEEFQNKMNVIYGQLWDMANPEKGCNYHTGREQTLYKIINLIDNEMVKDIDDPVGIWRKEASE